MLTFKQRQDMIDFLLVRNWLDHRLGVLYQVVPDWDVSDMCLVADHVYPSFKVVGAKRTEYTEAARAVKFMYALDYCSQVNSVDDAIDLLLNDVFYPFGVISAYNVYLRNLGKAAFVFPYRYFDEFWKAIEDKDRETLKTILESREYRDIIPTYVDETDEDHEEYFVG